MTKRCFLVLMTLLAPVASASAEEATSQQGTPPAATCSCQCETAIISLTVTFPDVGLGCAALEGSACVLRDPVTSEQLSGQASACTPIHNAARSVSDPAGEPLRSRW